MGTRHCPLESDYFDGDEFEVWGQTIVHMNPPPHRVVDGWLVETDGQGGVRLDRGDVVLVRPPLVEPVGSDALPPSDR